MTIGKGTEWGTPGLLPSGAPVISSDEELFHYVNQRRSEGVDLSAVGLSGGALWSMIGGGSVPGRLFTPESRMYPCDIGRVDTGHESYWFVSSLVARTSTWSRVFLAMNVQDVGPYRFGHRAHPGDGLLDVYEARLALQQRVLVAQRAKLGAHLPHPQIRERRVSSARTAFDRPLPLWLDGVRCAKHANLSITLEVDALTVVV
jgi:hypothetical protein